MTAVQTRPADQPAVAGSVELEYRPASARLALGPHVLTRRVVAVVDPIAVTGALLPDRFTDLAAGRLGVLARPGMRRASWLAADLLAALGCRDDVAGAGRSGEGDWDHVATWLCVHHIRHLYVRHAWTLPLRALEALLRLLDQVPVTIWLVGDTLYTAVHADTLRDWTDDTIAGDDFLDHWNHLAHTAPPAQPTSTTTPAVAPGPTQRWPERVPDDDFTTFRAACRRLLDTGEFDLVDAHLRDHVPEAERRARTLPDDAGAREIAVAAWLHQHWEQSESMAAYVVLVRAAQVGFFRAGWYLQVDLDQLIGTASTMSRRALRTPELWQRLHAYPEPHRGAICALAAAGLSVDTISALTVADVDPDGTVRLPDGTIVRVQAEARPFLAAQIRLRLLQPPPGPAPLFPTRQGRPLSGPAIAQIINDARRELGVAVAPDRLDRKPVTGDRWTTRWGVCLKELPCPPC